MRRRSLTWSVDGIGSIPVELDFSSSGLGRRAATAIEADGVRLCNAIELVEVGPDATQVQLCESCGFPGCSSGGWVALRRVGARAAWLPAWDSMEEDDQDDRAPPEFLRSRGVPLFDVGSWERLQVHQAALPGIDELPPVNTREAARLCQWSAPGAVLGEFPARPRLRRESLTAVSEGQLLTVADEVDAWLQVLFEGRRPMEVAPDAARTSPLEFWLDLPGTPGWSGVARIDGRCCLRLDDHHVLVAAEE